MDAQKCTPLYTSAYLALVIVKGWHKGCRSLLSSWGDVGTLKEKLQERYGITERRAKTIAWDQNNKATESISRVRILATGITHGIWVHTSVGKSWRKSHVAANGKVFDLRIGLMIDGETVLPGECVSCNCTYKPVIPGFNGEEMRA